ncbi:tyrosine-type recombinase/integrase [Prosthecomicrobium hirschii]|nr:tyrosine-type recombinase/integrase [Prosthecomicrobium hirschii]MCW1841315.1 tyrosine-type recombinase/integrase [Prosthecomicrobium hirschii]
MALSLKLEAIWAAVRIEQFGIAIAPTTPRQIEFTVASPRGEPQLKLSDARSVYFRLKGAEKGKGFHVSAERHIGYAMECLGDVAIEAMSRTDAGQFRDFLIRKGLSSSSIRRVLASVRAAVNLTIGENGLKCGNPFTGIFIPTVGEKTVRKPISPDAIRTIQKECLSVDDEKRLLIALISDTGMRLAEAAGLIRQDIVLVGPIPHVIVRTHPWRSLKTPSSQRTIPLIGASLQAAHRLLGRSKSRFIFPAYASEDGVNANSASAALNKWLKPRLPAGCVIHSFRHSLRDRLRAVECPADIVDAIGGWTTQGVGHGYGSGYPLDVLHRWMMVIEIE